MARHQLAQLAPHVGLFSPGGTTDRPVLGVVTGASGSLIVDAGSSADHIASLLQAMCEQGIAAPRYAALTHWHWDHVFGAAELAISTFA